MENINETFISQNDLEEIQEEICDDELTYFNSPYMIQDTEFIDKVTFNKEQFQKGIDEASRFCGIYTAFVNSGVSAEGAINLIFNMQNIETNIKLTEINKEVSIAVSKNQQAVIEKTQV